jgi:hypothetical protein
MDFKKSSKPIQCLTDTVNTTNLRSLIEYMTFFFDKVAETVGNFVVKVKK